MSIREQLSNRYVKSAALAVFGLAVFFACYYPGMLVAPSFEDNYDGPLDDASIVSGTIRAFLNQVNANAEQVYRQESCPSALAGFTTEYASATQSRLFATICDEPVPFGMNTSTADDLCQEAQAVAFAAFRITCQQALIANKGNHKSLALSLVITFLAPACLYLLVDRCNRASRSSLASQSNTTGYYTLST